MPTRVTADQPLEFGIEPSAPKNKPALPEENRGFTNLGSEPTESKKSLRIETETEVSDKEIFRLGKFILLFCGLAYLLIATLKIINPASSAVDEVWNHATVFLTSFISLVLGLYFGQKSDNQYGESYLDL